MVLRLPNEERIPAPAKANPERWLEFKTGILEVVSNRILVIASALEAAMYVGYGAFLGFFPIYAEGVGHNDAAIGLIMGAQLATTMIGKPAGGWLSDRLGRKPVILAGLGVCAVMLPLVVLGESFFSLLVLSCLFGLGVAIVTPSTTALVADLAKAGRMGSAMGVFGTIWDSGEAAGPILAGFLIASLSFFNGFFIISGLMALAAVIFAITIKDPIKPLPPHQAQENPA
jgi:MFS family permease